MGEGLFGVAMILVAGALLMVLIPVRSPSGDWRWRRVMGLGFIVVMLGVLLWIVA